MEVITCSVWTEKINLSGDDNIMRLVLHSLTISEYHHSLSSSTARIIVHVISGHLRSKLFHAKNVENFKEIAELALNHIA